MLNFNKESLKSAGKKAGEVATTVGGILTVVSLIVDLVDKGHEIYKRKKEQKRIEADAQNTKVKVTHSDDEKVVIELD